MLDTLCRRSSSRRSILGRGVTLGMLPPVARVSVDVAAWEAGRIREGISGTTMRGVSRRLQRRTKSRNDRAAAVSESSARYRKLWYGPYESRESRYRGASRCVRTTTQELTVESIEGVHSRLQDFGRPAAERRGGSPPSIEAGVSIGVVTVKGFPWSPRRSGRRTMR